MIRIILPLNAACFFDKRGPPIKMMPLFGTNLISVECFRTANLASEHVWQTAGVEDARFDNVPTFLMLVSEPWGAEQKQLVLELPESSYQTIGIGLKKMLGGRKVKVRK